MISLLFAFTSHFFNVQNLADGLLNLAPPLCQSALPEGPYRALYAAFICGQHLPPSQEKQLFIDAGLIHLMVVSGWHLMFLEILLGFLPGPLCFSILVAYGFLSGMHIPIVRALLRRLVRPWLGGRLGLTPLQIEAVVAAGLLILIPEWLCSRSFLMSWMGGMAFCLPWRLTKYRALDRAIFAYLVLLPFCMLPPLSLLWSLLFAPVMGFVYLPACILAMLIPGLCPLTDFLWRVLLAILSWGPTLQPAAVFFSAAQLLWLPPLTHTVLLVLEVRWRRACAFLLFSP